ncbi:MAG: hypothetical protein EOM93_05425 [Gammaproteobacteria bacterium]|jgi:hypothetical protein|nr:hypothetical protein [Gammaproteobacteria bacterium]
MNDFKSMAKTGKDFAVILYDQVNEDIENTIIEIRLDKMKMRTVLCEEGETSLTLQPLPNGDYEYTITQIQNESVYKSEGKFIINPESNSNADILTKLENIEAKLNDSIKVRVTKMPAAQPHYVNL